MLYSLNNHTAEDFKKIIDEVCRGDTDRLLDIRVAKEDGEDTYFYQANSVDISLDRDGALRIEIDQ